MKGRTVHTRWHLAKQRGVPSKRCSVSGKSLKRARTKASSLLPMRLLKAFDMPVNCGYGGVGWGRGGCKGGGCVFGGDGGSTAKPSAGEPLRRPTSLIWHRPAFSARPCCPPAVATATQACVPGGQGEGRRARLAPTVQARTARQAGKRRQSRDHRPGGDRGQGMAAGRPIACRWSSASATPTGRQQAEEKQKW